MTFRILVVCNANLCRSPLAAAVLLRAVSQHEVGRRITVETGGVDAPVGKPVCPEMLRLADSRGVRTVEFPRHLARAVTAPQIQAADLVLATDRRVRSNILKRVPQVGGSTFTLREAAELGARAMAEVRGRTLDERLRSFAAEMNGSRGLTDLPRSRSVALLPTPWRRMTVHAHDIPDAHQGEHAPHRVTYQLTVSSARRLAEGLATSAPSAVR